MWIAKRIVTAVFMLWIVMTLTFFLIRFMPGDPAMYMTQQLIMGRTFTPEEINNLIRAYIGINPDEPMLVQYKGYLLKLLKGDLGTSFLFPKTPVKRIMAQAVPWTVFIVSLSLILSFIVGTSLGRTVAYRRGTRFDTWVTMVSSVLSAIPNYVTALLLLYFLGAILRIFPMRGAYDSSVQPGFTFEFMTNVLYHAALPVSAFIITAFGGWLLSMRANTISVLGEDYIMAAQAKGISDRRIMSAYVGKNAILPLFTNLTLQIGFMFGGSLFIENIFSYPGIGYYLSASVSGRDYPVMQACFLLLTVAVLFSNIVADLLYGKLDPRIRLGGR